MNRKRTWVWSEGRGRGAAAVTSRGFGLDREGHRPDPEMRYLRKTLVYTREI